MKQHSFLYFVICLVLGISMYFYRTPKSSFVRWNNTGIPSSLVVELYDAGIQTRKQAECYAKDIVYLLLDTVSWTSSPYKFEISSEESRNGKLWHVKCSNSTGRHIEMRISDKGYIWHISTSGFEHSLCTSAGRNIAIAAEQNSRIFDGCLGVKAASIALDWVRLLGGSCVGLSVGDVQRLPVGWEIAVFQEGLGGRIYKVKLNEYHALLEYAGDLYPDS